MLIEKRVEKKNVLRMIEEAVVTSMAFTCFNVTIDECTCVVMVTNVKIRIVFSPKHQCFTCSTEFKCACNDFSSIKMEHEGKDPKCNCRKQQCYEETVHAYSLVFI